MLKKVLATTAVTLSALALTAPAAQAATGWDRCPAGYICLFDERDGQGGMAWFAVGSPDLRGQNFDNRTDSVWNRNASSFRLYVDYNYSTNGGAGTFPAGVRTNVNDPNKYSSLKKA